MAYSRRRARLDVLQPRWFGLENSRGTQGFFKQLNVYRTRNKLSFFFYYEHRRAKGGLAAILARYAS